jgi:hypothetical protein
MLRVCDVHVVALMPFTFAFVVLLLLLRVHSLLFRFTLPLLVRSLLRLVFDCTSLYGTLFVVRCVYRLRYVVCCYVEICWLTLRLRLVVIAPFAFVDYAVYVWYSFVALLFRLRYTSVIGLVHFVVRCYCCSFYCCAGGGCSVIGTLLLLLRFLFVLFDCSVIQFPVRWFVALRFHCQFVFELRMLRSFCSFTLFVAPRWLRCYRCWISLPFWF